MHDLWAQSIQLTQATMLRRAADGMYSAIENVDVASMLAAVRAISLRDNNLQTLDGLQFCTNLRALDVCFVSVSHAPAVVRRRCSSNVVRRMLFVERSAMIFGRFDSSALQVSLNRLLTSLPPLATFRFLEFLIVRALAVRATRTRAGKWSRDIDCSLAHQVTDCASLTSLVGLESVTTMHTLMVCWHACTHACVCACGRDINLNAAVGVGHAVALVDIAARLASHQNRG